MTTVPSELLAKYKDNFKTFGHDEALRQLRQSIVSRLGHAWFQSNRKKIEAELRAVEERCSQSAPAEEGGKWSRLGR